MTFSFKHMKILFDIYLFLWKSYRLVEDIKVICATGFQSGFFFQMSESAVCISFFFSPSHSFHPFKPSWEVQKSL